MRNRKSSTEHTLLIATYAAAGREPLALPELGPDERGRLVRKKVIGLGGRGWEEGVGKGLGVIISPDPILPTR